MMRSGRRRKTAGRLKKRLIIGLTGTFGSGKSSVGKLFALCGAEVVDSDRLVHAIFERKKALRAKMKRMFGLKEWDRRQIAAVVFKDAKKRKALERAVHPYVFQELKKEIARIDQGVLILEVPLLFETGADRFCDFTMSVVTGKEVIFRRMRDKGFEEADVRLRQKAQFSESEKKRRADFLIDNSRSKRHLKKQVKEIWNCLALLVRR